MGGDDEENPVPEGWVALPGTKIVRETNHRKYNTRDQIDERLETEQVQQLGSISHKVRLFFLPSSGICRNYLVKTWNAKWKFLSDPLFEF